MVRGGSRGRRGRYRGNGRQGHSNVNIGNVDVEDVKTFVEDQFDITSDKDKVGDREFRKLFLNKSKFSQHYEAQQKLPHRYFACLHVLIKNGVQILDSSKSLSLAAVWARRDYKMAEYLLKIPKELFGIKEVLKALQILDAARNKRAHEKLLKRLEAQGCKKKFKMALLKSMIGSLEAEIPPVGSVSGALVRHVKQWIKTIPAERFEFYAQYFKPDPWKKLADLLHLHPEKDVPQCPWFLKFCFGNAEIPTTSSVSSASVVTAENISESVLATDIDYSVVRKHHTHLTDEAKERIATYTKLETVLWYYTEISCPKVDKVILKRLEDGEKSNLPYGKLMDRLMLFSSLTTQEGNESTKEAIKKLLIKEADSVLKELKFDLEAPVVVLGDKSGSMQVAVRTSNIIASLVTAVCNGKLMFFDSVNVLPPFIPEDVEGVLRLSEQIKAMGGTTPAASMVHCYNQAKKKKEIIKTFVVVSDEGENGTIDSYEFHTWFKRYYDEIFPAKLVFISFLRQTEAGYMYSKVHPDIKPMQFRFNADNPDLSKLDNVFGVLSSENEGFSKLVDEVEKMFIDNDLEAAVNMLTL